MVDQLRITGLEVPSEVLPGGKLAEVLESALADAGMSLHDQDLVVFCQKIVSKAENRYVDLNKVVPGQQALELSAICLKDPRLVQVILSQSTDVIRCVKNVLIVRHKLGLIVANAAVDQSNIPGNGQMALLLPADPDASATNLRNEIKERFGVTVAVIISDSFGRPWRMGVCGVAIGCAGFCSLIDERGRVDRFGRALRVTQIAAADQLAAAAVMVMGEADEGRPIAVVSGLARRLFENEVSARELIRPQSFDLFS